MMQLFRLDQDTGRRIQSFDSQNIAYTHVADHIRDADVGVMHLSPGGRIGYHQAAGDQLFMVVQGSGWAAGLDHQPAGIDAGQAAFWRAGEWHEAGTETGMTAVVIEANAIEPRLSEILPG